MNARFPEIKFPVLPNFNIPTTGFKRGEISMISSLPADIKAKSGGIVNRLLLAYRAGAITYEQMLQQLEKHVNTTSYFDYEAWISQETLDTVLAAAQTPAEPKE